MQRLIFAAELIFPITFFCAGVREFFGGITERVRWRISINGKNWARPGHGRAQTVEHAWGVRARRKAQ